MKQIISIVLALVILSLNTSCKKDKEGTSGSNNVVPDVYKKIYGASSITSDGSFVYIKTTGVPDHKSIYYPASNALYENFSGTTFGGNNFNKNPNSIATQNYTFKIPLNPKVATNHQATPLGAIGVSL